MRSKVFRCISTAIILGALCLARPASAEDENHWPNWRGPNYDGSLEGVDPPTSWSGSENIRWKVPVPGKGSGTPIVWGDQVILLTAIDTGQAAEGEAPEEQADRTGAEPQQERGDDRRGRRGRGGRGGRRAPATVHEFIVISFDLADGEEQWRTIVHRAVPHETGHQTNTHASSSAVTDGQHIYVSFGSHGVYALDMQGEILWSKQLGRMQTRNQFGEGSSPTLIDGHLIVPWDHEGDSSLFALDTSTGDILWQVARDERTTWATPLAVKQDGRTQVVTNGSIVRSYDVETGELIWSCGGQVSNPIPTPVRIDDYVICMTGYRGNAIYAMPLDAKGDISDSNRILWSNREAAPYVASPVLYKGRLYFTKSRSGVMSSINALTGEVLIPQTRLSGIDEIYASPVAAGDKIYFTGRDGVTTVIRHSTTLEELAVNELGEPVDASPAIVGDTLLVRGAEHLYRIGKE